MTPFDLHDLFDLLFLPNPQFHSNFPDIPGEERKLPERNADDEYGKGPYDSNKKDVDYRPKPVLLDGENIHDLFCNKAGGATPYSECAKDQGQLQPAYFPFFLKSFEHGAAKVRKKPPTHILNFTLNLFYQEVDSFVTKSFEQI